jgi:hypothetical protein
MWYGSIHIAYPQDVRQHSGFGVIPEKKYRASEKYRNPEKSDRKRYGNMMKINRKDGKKLKNRLGGKIEKWNVKNAVAN